MTKLDAYHPQWLHELEALLEQHRPAALPEFYIAIAPSAFVGDFRYFLQKWLPEYEWDKAPVGETADIARRVLEGDHAQ